MAPRPLKRDDEEAGGARRKGSFLSRCLAFQRTEESCGQCGARGKRYAFKHERGCRICAPCFPTVSNTQGEESSVDSSIRRFKSEEQELPPLSIQDLKQLLNLISAEVDSLTPLGSHSSTSALLTQTISQYEKRKESLNSFIESLPDDLIQKVVGGTKDVLMPLLTKALGGAENVQWAGVGLRLIAWTLENMQTTMQNREVSIEILKNALDLMKTIAEVWEREAANYNSELQKTIEIAFRCAIICTSNVRKRAIFRFFDAARVQKTMDDLRKDLHDAKQDVLMYMVKRGYSPNVDQQIIYGDGSSSNDTVGRDESIQKAWDILNKDSNNTVALCLHGMGGIGKSSIGLEIFKKFQAITKSSDQQPESQPYRTCRVELELGIEDIKKLVDIQKEILGKLCGIEVKTMNNCTDGRERLRVEINKISAPIFLYLDNVLEPRHLEEILPKASCFPQGSKLLLTSRGTNVEIGVKGLGIEKRELMEVNKLKDEDARELLWRHISGRKEIVSSSDDLKKLEKEVLKLCGGLPLALKVVGGFIGGSADEGGPAKKEVWQHVVEAMSEARAVTGEAHDELYSRIEFSIESLHARVRKAFLDIVSFLDPHTTWEIVERLVGQDLHTLHRRGLVQQTSGTDDEGESRLEIEIHDVLLALARRMIDDDKDELRITGRENWKKLAKEQSGKLKLVVALKDARVEAHILQQMPSLRYLKNVIGVRGKRSHGASQLDHLSVVDCLSSDAGELLDLKGCARLKQLSWRDADYAPDLEFLRHQNVAEQLQVLELSHWRDLKDVNVIQTLRCLKRLELTVCHQLKTLPEDWTGLTGLEILRLGPAEISRLPDGMGALTSLTMLVMRGCHELECLPESFSALKSLRTLSLLQCQRFDPNLPKGVLAGMTSLARLHIHTSQKLKSLTEELASLTRLARLSLDGCESLWNVGPVASLTGLTYLSFHNCLRLKSLEALTTLTQLTELNLTFSLSFGALPAGFSALTCLTKLNLHFCSRLQALPAGFSRLIRLTKLDLGYCKALQALPAGFSRLTSLTSLNLSEAHNLSSGLDELRSLTGLKELEPPICEALYALMRDETFCPGVLGMVTSVKLPWSECFPYLPKCLPCFTSLRRLELLGDHGVDLQLCFPQQLTSLTALQVLRITGCGRVQTLPPGFTNLRSLTKLTWRGCSSLQSLKEIAGMTGLEELSLTGGEHSMLLEICTLTGLRCLDLSRWENMRFPLPEELVIFLRQVKEVYLPRRRQY